MGTVQRTDTYCSKLTADVSPTIVDMFGSVRSKIFSILKIIEKDGDKYETAKKHYKVLLDELPTEDRVSLSQNHDNKWNRTVKLRSLSDDHINVC